LVVLMSIPVDAEEELLLVELNVEIVDDDAVFEDPASSCDADTTCCAALDEALSFFSWYLILSFVNDGKSGLILSTILVIAPYGTLPELLAFSDSNSITIWLRTIPSRSVFFGFMVAVVKNIVRCEDASPICTGWNSANYGAVVAILWRGGRAPPPLTISPIIRNHTSPKKIINWKGRRTV
jgi:hypothetical protein